MSTYTEYHKKYYQNNKNKPRLKYKEYQKQYRKNNSNIKEKIKESNKKWYEKTKEYRKPKVKEYSKKYYQNNKEKIREYKREYFKAYRKNNIAMLLRGRIRSAIKSQNTIKQFSTISLIGCSINHLKEHLQQTAFQNGYLNFNINDFSGKEYHIDHIVPCSLFNLKCSYHQKICFHWSNMQILSAKENLEKQNSLIY